MTSFQIIIKNQSGADREYLLFNEPPQPNGGGKNGFSNVWFKTTGTPSPNGTQTINIPSEIFAMCGTLPDPLAHGVVVTESDSLLVTLATDKVPGTVANMVLKNGSPAFTPPSGTTTMVGTFGINTGDWNEDQYAGKIWIGMGRYDANNNIVPVASFSSTPNAKYTFQPVNTFYISTSSSFTGAVIDIQSTGVTATIDFRKAKPGQTIATIVQNGDEQYGPTVFSYPS